MELEECVEVDPKACGNSGNGGGFKEPIFAELLLLASAEVSPAFVHKKFAKLILLDFLVLYIATKALFSSSFFMISKRRFRRARS